MTKYYRTFNGKRYKLVGKTNSKSRANQAAEHIRQRGHNARVVPLGKGWYAIYRG